MKAHIDFETRSELDLQKVGAWEYASHPSTEVLCVAVRVIDDIMLFTKGDLNTNFLCHSILNRIATKGELYAFNAQFERLIWAKVLGLKHGFAVPTLEQWNCVQAQAYTAGLGGSLEKVAGYLGLEQQKDLKGKALMLKLCKAGYQETPEEMERLIRYCEQDVLTEMAIHAALPEMPESERQIYMMDQKINDHGVAVDVDSVKEIIRLMEIESKILTERFKDVVGGALDKPGQVAKFLEWLEKQGHVLPNLQANTVANYLERDGLDPSVREALELRTLAQSAVKKYQKIVETVSADGRIRGLYQYHGAATGRFAGRGAQPQNFPRPSGSYNGALDIQDKRYVWPVLYDCIHKPAKESLRSVFWAPKGKLLHSADFSSIEARVTAWLAGQKDRLELFRQGKDIYCAQASVVFGREITKKDKDERQLGKAMELAFGYQGGISAMAAACSMFRVSLSPLVQTLLPTATSHELDSAEYCSDLYFKKVKNSKDIDPAKVFKREESLVADIIKQRWRKANLKISDLWGTLEVCMVAVGTPAYQIPGTNILLRFGNEGDFRYIQLPYNSRKLWYYKPRMTVNENGRKSFSALTIDSLTKKLVRRQYYGGLITENIVQAIARDLQVESMKVFEDEVVLHTHDDITLERDEEADLQELLQIMSRERDWAPGLPLSAEGQKGKRYGK